MSEQYKTFAEMMAEIDADPERRSAADADIFLFRLGQALMQRFEIERADKQLSKADLAKVVNVNPVTVRRVLTDPSANPRLSTLVALANALDCEITLVPRGQGHRVTASTR